MIPLALIRPFLPALGLIIAAGAAWWWHRGQVNEAYDRGVSEITAKWQEADRLAVAVGDETSKLLKRGSAAVEGNLNAKLKTLAARDADRARNTASLRQLVDELAATPPGRRDPAAACRSYEAEYRSCAGLLSEGIGLAGEGERMGQDLAARLTAMQEWARLVANEAP